MIYTKNTGDLKFLNKKMLVKKIPLFYYYLFIFLFYLILLFFQENMINIKYLTVFTVLITLFFFRKIIPAIIFLVSIFQDLYFPNTGFSISSGTIIYRLSFFSTYTVIIFFTIYIYFSFKGYNSQPSENFEITNFVISILTISLLATLRGLMIKVIDSRLLAYNYLFWLFFWMFTVYFIFRFTRVIETIEINIRLILFVILIHGVIRLSYEIPTFTQFLKFHSFFSDSILTKDYLLPFMPLFFFSLPFIFLKDLITKFIYFIISVICFYCLIYSYSIPALFSSIVLYNCLILFFLFKSQLKKVGIMIIIMFTFVLSLKIFLNSDYKNYFNSQVTTKKEYRAQKTNNENMKITFDIKKNTDSCRFLKYWREYPIFGLGLASEQNFNSSLFNTIAQTGIINIVVILLLLIWLLKKTNKMYYFYRYRDNFIAQFLCGYLLFLIAFTVIFIFEDALSFDVMISSLAIFTAFILRIITISRNI